MGNILRALTDDSNETAERARQQQLYHNYLAEEELSRERVQREYYDHLRQEQQRRIQQQFREQKEQEENDWKLTVQWNFSLILTMHRMDGIEHGWMPWNAPSLSESVNYIKLPKNHKEFVQVKRLFDNTSRNQEFQILQVERCQNSILYGQFLIKKEELQSRYGSVHIELLFHGTRLNNIQAICENNFNWRLHGCSLGNRYGKGVSFSPIATYASHYCDKKLATKVMLLCKVLIGPECIGDSHMQLPEVYNYKKQLRYDTAIKDDNKRSVIVKFSDHEYYPLYKIHFRGPSRKNMQNRPALHC